MATVWIIREYFATYTVSAVIIGQYAISDQGRQLQSDIMDEVLRTISNPEVIIKYLVEGEMYPQDDSEATMSAAEIREKFFRYYSNPEKSIWFLDSIQAYK